MQNTTVAEAEVAEPAPDAPLVLVVDDDRANLESVARLVARERLRVVTAPSGEEALSRVRKGDINLVVADLMMPGMTGQELLRACRAVAPDTEVVLMTAYGTVETAVAAMKDGAYDFITKPLKRHALVKTIRQALDKQALIAENRALRAKLADLGNPGHRAVVGRSPAFRSTLDTLQQASPSSATILLTGESGTGKELAARLIHDGSPRSQGPFIPINCAAIPETILESELFGYERGAFTGAVARKEGRFERAHQGTLFLDEVGEMSPAVQVKLLRVLQEGEFERLGGKAPIRVDVRVVAATNKDLKKLVSENRFREDLYYRLNVVQVHLPALRERREDVPLLADHFLKAFARKNNKAVSGFTQAAMEKIERYAWPGNVRELENAIERAVVLCRTGQLDVIDLPESVRQGPEGSAHAVFIPIGMPMEEVEMRVIDETLRHTKGDKTLAAQLLGIATRTIYRKLEAQREPTATPVDVE
jgi:two-component system, NtrC family, response regulator HydG